MSLQDLYALIPLSLLGIGAVVLLLAGAFMPSLGRRTLNLLGASIAFASALAAALYHPSAETVGGMIRVVGFGRFFSAVSGVTALITLLLSIGYAGRRPLGDEEYPALVLFAAFGMSVLGTSVSLLGVFLGLESMSLALYILLASNKADPLSGESGLKYLIVGAVSTAFFAFGLGLIYAATGTLSMPGSMQALASAGTVSPLGLAGWAMLLVGLGFKASLFPFHFWAPDVYEGGPAPVVAFLSTGSKSAVFAAFLQMSIASSAGWGSLVPVLWVMAALTMAYGNVAALTQDNVKRMLAYSSIAQMGYVLVALIAAPKTEGAAAVFYLVAYIAMDLGAFGVVAAFSGRDRDLGDIEALRGLGFTHPFRGLVLSVCMLSLAGLPPTAGFIGKFGIFFSAVKAGYVYLAVIGIITATVSVYYYLRVVVCLYMRPVELFEPELRAPYIIPKQDPAGRIAMAAVVAVIIYLGILPGRLLDLLAGLI